MKIHSVAAATALLFFFVAPPATSTEAAEPDPGQLLDMAYSDFRSGDSEASRQSAERALSIGQSKADPDIIGGALAALCRLALRDNDAAAIGELTARMHDVATSSGQEKWDVYAIHMRAELARMNGRLDEADKLYVESLELSRRIGLTGMVAAENFNRSFISVKRGDLEGATEQVREYFAVSARSNNGTPGAYGLIALANLLAAREAFDQAAVVVFAAHRIFGERGIVPDPADAAPLQEVERVVSRRLTEAMLAESSELATNKSVSELVDEYL